MQVSKMPWYVLLTLQWNIRDNPDEIMLIKTLRDGGFTEEAEQCRQVYLDALELAVNTLIEHKVSF